MRVRRWTAHRLHRWAGLIAGLWLAVLGATGFILDHRDWSWLWQGGLSADRLPARIGEKARQGHIRLYRILDEQHRLAGGPTGLWWSADAGRHWDVIRAERGGRLPPVNQLLRTDAGWILATADGLWRLQPEQATARPWMLSGRAVTAIAPRDARRFWIVLERGEVLSLDRKTEKVEPFGLPTVSETILPASIDLSRLVHDLHFGRGLFVAPWSLLWSDAAAFGLLILPLGGFLYWWLPRYFRQRRRAGQPLAASLRRGMMRFLYRSHAPTTGLLVVVPFVYLSVTGILLDHGTVLRSWMKQVHLPMSVLPPVYDMSSWNGEIRAIVGWPAHPDRLSLGTRLGLFTIENGRVWREPPGNGRGVFVWMARQDDRGVALGGMGGPNYLWQEGHWERQPHGAHMPSDVTRDRSGRWLWKTRDGLRFRAGDGYRTLPVNLPVPDFVPWYFIIDGLHSGMLIHPWWKWVNDAVALLALLLAGTGLWRWWKVKWV